MTVEVRAPKGRDVVITINEGTAYTLMQILDGICNITSSSRAGVDSLKVLKEDLRDADISNMSRSAVAVNASGIRVFCTDDEW